MSTIIGFNENDFFYNNVNAPIQFDPALCSKPASELELLITNTLNIPTEITPGPVTALDQKQGQCGFRLFDPNRDDPALAANSWSMRYVIDKGLQTCKCVKNDPQPQYIDSYINSFNTKLQGSAINNNKYVCNNSIPVEIKDSSINDIKLDQKVQKEIIRKAVDYYTKVCKNKELAISLMNMNATNSNSEVKQSDINTFYNREYLNRINLGVGIILSVGLIYYTIVSGNSPPSIIPSLPKPPSNI